MTTSGTAVSKPITRRSTPSWTPVSRSRLNGRLRSVGQAGCRGDRQAAAGDDQADDDHHVGDVLQLGI